MTKKSTGRFLRTALAVAAAAAITACASWIPTTKGIDIDDMPKRPAESIQEIVKDGDIVEIDKLSVAGSDRWQVEYRDGDDKLRYVAVKEDGDKVDWVGDTPVDFDNVPKRPKDAIAERTDDGKIITIRRGQVLGKDRWTVRWRDDSGKRQEFTVGEDGEKID